MSDPNRSDRPATFREVLAVGEYRAVYASSALSWLGDYLARAAVTGLVFHQTDSVVASAAAFAISFLPWVAGGPVLAAIAERNPHRQVMVVCDLVRMGCMAAIALPGIPVPAMLALLFVTALFNPPFDAARSALLPRILDGDRYVVGVTLQTTTNQMAQLVGYVLGGALVAYDARLGLLINAATFGVSALFLGLGVRSRPPALARAQRTHLLRETAEGFGVVFGTPVLRAIALMVFASMLFSIVPEGLAAAWAGDLAASRSERGWMQAMIMVANPVGFIVGGLLVGRLVGPTARQRLIRPLAVLAPLALVPALLSPGVYGVAAMAFVSGFAIAGLMPPANGLFVRALPTAFRARAFGVMQAGVQIMQGVGVLVAGLFSDRYPLPVVVGVWSLVGIGLMLAVSMGWPAPEHFADAITHAQAVNAGTVHATPAAAAETSAPRRVAEAISGEGSRAGGPEAEPMTANL